MASHNELGKWGEDVATTYLEQKGWQIVERNWKIDHLEVDIIATDGRMLLFAEVKTRRSNNYGDPHEAVDWRKRRHLITAMRRYIGIYRVNLPVRFDVISVIGTPNGFTISQIEDAVSGYAW